MRTPKRLRPNAVHESGVIEFLDDGRIRTPESEPVRRAVFGESGVSSPWADRRETIGGVGQGSPQWAALNPTQNHVFLIRDISKPGPHKGDRVRMYA
jgi:hypothetical protein